MEKFFEPKSIAVIGASRHKEKVGYAIFKNLLSSRKKVYPINPNAKKICGRIAYNSVLKIKEDIDLAIIVIPAKFVPEVLKECGEKDIKNVIIISAGFSESGNEKLEKKLVDIALKYNIRYIGPNCLGTINPHQKLNATFFGKNPKKGKIAFISQSGALGVAVLDRAIEKGMGLSLFASIGNATNIGFSEMIKYLDKDKNTKAICLYVESLRKGKKFLNVVSKIKKPVIVLKGGMTKKGQEAAATHTAALMSENGVYTGAFKQCGAIKTESIYELFEIGSYLSKNKPIKGNRGIIVTNAGGAGVLSADAFEKNGLELAKIPKSIIKKLDKELPMEWSRSNPIDIVGDATPERYKKTLDIIKKGNFYDFIFIALTPQKMTNPKKVAKILVEFQKKSKTPIFSCFMGGELIKDGKILLTNENILNFEEPTYGIGMISKMVK